MQLQLGRSSLGEGRNQNPEAPSHAEFEQDAESCHTVKSDPFILTENVTGTHNMEDQEMKGRGDQEVKWLTPAPPPPPLHLPNPADSSSRPSCLGPPHWPPHGSTLNPWWPLTEPWLWLKVEARVALDNPALPAPGPRHYPRGVLCGHRHFQ